MPPHHKATRQVDHAPQHRRPIFDPRLVSCGTRVTWSHFWLRRLIFNPFSSKLSRLCPFSGFSMCRLLEGTPRLRHLPNLLHPAFRPPTTFWPAPSRVFWLLFQPSSILPSFVAQFFWPRLPPISSSFSPATPSFVSPFHASIFHQLSPSSASRAYLVL